MKKLPKMFRGMPVIRGKALHYKKHEALEEDESEDEFPMGDFYVVVANGDAREHASIRTFKNKKKAVRYAQSCSNGNVDHRVLHVTDNILVIATSNEL